MTTKHPKVSVLIEQLKAHDIIVRMQAVDALADLKHPDAVEPLISALKDKDLIVRRSAVKALGEMGDLRAVQALKTVLKKDEFDFIRSEARFALERIRDGFSVCWYPALDQGLDNLFGLDKTQEIMGRRTSDLHANPTARLIADFKSARVKERRGLAESMVKVGTPIVEPLVELLKTSKSTSVRENAAWALGEIRDPRAIDSVVAAMSDDDLNVRTAASEALEKLISGCVQTPKVQATFWRKALPHFIRGAAPQSLNCIDYLGPRLSRNDPHRKMEAIAALKCIEDKRAIKAILEYVSDNDPDVRFKAIETLWEQNDEQSIAATLIRSDLRPLIEAMCDNGIDGQTRLMAAEIMRDVKDPIATDYAISIFANEKQASREDDEEDDVSHSWSSIAISAGVLGSLADPRAVEPLVAALKERTPHIRAVAAEALGLVGDPRVVEPLLLSLKDDAADVRRAAAEALGTLGDDRIVEPLIAAIRDSDYCVAEAARTSLRKLEPKVLCTKLTNWDINEIVVEMLGKWSPQTDEEKIHVLVAARRGRALREEWNIAKKVLLRDVESSDYKAIENALYAFMGIGNEDIIAPLRQTLSAKGNKTMAEAYLNCGHPDLAAAASEWAARNGYTIRAGAGSHPVSWRAWH